MKEKFIGPDNLPENSGVGPGPTDLDSIAAAGASWRRSLTANADGETAWEAAVGASREVLENGNDSVLYAEEDDSPPHEIGEVTPRMYAAYALINLIIDARNAGSAKIERRALAYLATPGQLANGYRETFQMMLGIQI